MSYLVVNRIPNFVWQNLIIASAVFWSTATTAYILTRRLYVAGFTHALMMVLLPYYYWFDVLLGSGIYYWVLTRSTKNRELSAWALMIPIIISQTTFAAIHWEKGWTFISMFLITIGSALASPLSIVIGKMFKKC